MNSIFTKRDGKDELEFCTNAEIVHPPPIHPHPPPSIHLQRDMK